MPSNKRNALFTVAVVAGLGFVFLLSATAQQAGRGGTSAPATPAGALSRGFLSPPHSAAPRVWWHWMNGNVTEEGIRKDLEWMHRVGIGGMNQIEAGAGTTQVVKNRLVYMSQGWKNAFHLAAQLANRYGLELGIDSSPGWSETGGPWVKPAQAMKKMVWSATTVEGGSPISVKLPTPPDTAGPFQNVPLRGGFGSSFKAPNFYRDSIALAYKSPVSPATVVKATSNSGAIDASSLSDGSLIDGVTLTPEQITKRAWIEYDFGKPTRIQGLTLAMTAVALPNTETTLRASADGTSWRQITQLVRMRGNAASFPEQTISFAPVTTRYIRVEFAPSNLRPTRGFLGPGTAAPGVAGFGGRGRGFRGSRGAPPKPAYDVHELVAHTVATVNAFEAKAGFAIAPDNYALATKTGVASGTTVDPDDVVNVTRFMKPDGTLDWTPPAGRWVVLRIGYSLEGTTNHPAPAEATGLEVDKLSRQDVNAYIEHYLNMYKEITGPQLMGKHGLQALTMDSTEIGAQNWTDNILADFKADRGYDPTSWLPALTGVVVGSPARSDKFLWDFRQTIADLLAKNSYAEVVKVAHEYGLTVYGEATESHRPTFGDDMQMRQYNDIPMAAMWSWGSAPGPNVDYIADIEGAASVAHIYGQNLVAAESMTSAMQPWTYAPRTLKTIVDLEFATGVNRIVVHTSPEQPTDQAPGMTLMIFGQMFDRLENWANEAGPWVRYMARCDYMLQQGHFAADVAYFYGQDAPITGLFADKQQSAVPAGYGFDFVNPDVLENQLSVDNGNLVTRSGMRYRVLYLGGSSQYMTLNVLRRIRDFVNQGAVLVGKRPVGSPSLADNPQDFSSIADQLFGPPGSTAERSYGKGRVFPSGSLSSALAVLNLPPDFTYTKPEPDTDLLYLHRRLPDGDIYFISNRRDRAENVTATFRVDGRSPSIWNPVTGKTQPASFRVADGRTTIPLAMDPDGSAFVVFRTPTAAKSRIIPQPVSNVIETLHGPWTITFQPDRGAPPSITEPTLASWSVSTDPGVKYFSGTGTYTKTFQLPDGIPKPGSRVMLNLGEVRELARVTLNGKSLGIVWTPPYDVDITDAVKPGTNRLQVAVTNLWVNRLIGDNQPGVKKKYTFTTIPTFLPSAPLRVSGLLGPVEIREVK